MAREKSSLPIIGHRVDGGEAVAIDVERLTESRLLLQANSGAGKSWALRRILEQTHGKIQHIVLDVEDEFHTLRERYDYILAGRHGGDCPADLKSATLLARRLLELGVSAVIGMYELKAHERQIFMRRFLESLISAPRRLWHPTLVVIDEAQLFAPQKGKAESTAAVIDLMTRGRKRGFAGLLATTRLSKLHKDAAAEANNKLLGRAALDLDMRRVADELGFSTKAQLRALRTLKPGHFYAFGPAICDEVVEIVVGDVKTTHPRAGQRAAPPAPPRAKIKKFLAELADLPEQAEAEAKSLADLKTENRSLKAKLRAAEKDTPEAKIERVEVEVQVPVQVPVSCITPQEVEAMAVAAAAVTQAGKEIARVVRNAEKAIKRVHKGAFPFGVPSTVPSARATQSAARLDKATTAARKPAPAPAPVRRSNGETEVTGPEQRILDALAWLESVDIDEPSGIVLAFIAGYTSKSTSYTKARGTLCTKELARYPSPGHVALTDGGRAVAVTSLEPLTNEALQEAIFAKLGGPARRILKPLIDAYPDPLSNEDLADLAGYTAKSTSYTKARGLLRTFGFADYPDSGMICATDLLFLEER